MASARISSAIFVLSFIFVFGTSLTQAQSLKFGLHGRVLWLPDFKSVSELGYQSSHWAPSVDLEVRFSPYRGTIALAGDVSYAPLKGSETTHWLDESGAPMGERKYSAHLYIASLGAQFKFLQGATRPFLGARMQVSFISKVTMNSLGREDSEVLPSYGNNSARFGIGVLGGVEFDLDSNWSLDTVLRYNFTDVVDPTRPGYGNAFSIGIGVFYEII